MQVHKDWFLPVEFNSFDFSVNDGFPQEMKHKEIVKLFSICKA